MSLNESIVEDAALEWFRRRQGYAGQVGDPPTPPPSPRLWRSGRLRRTGLGYAVAHGATFAGLPRAKPPLAPGEPAAERDSFGEVVLVGRLREAIRRLNPANASGNPHPAYPKRRGVETRATLRKFRIVPIERSLSP